MRINIKLLITTLLLSAVLSACTGTKLLSSWVSPPPQKVKLEKIMVVSLMGGRYAAYQQVIENSVTSKLREAGVDATSGLSVMGPARLGDLEEKEVMDRLRSSGYTQVMLISLLDKQQESEYTPGYVSTYPVVVPGRGPFYGRYMVVYDRVYNPGYYTETTEYIMEAQVFCMTDNKLIYQAHTSTFDPGSTDRLMREFSETIVDDMRSKKMIDQS